MRTTRKIEMTLGTKEAGLVKWILEGGVEGTIFCLTLKRRSTKRGRYCKAVIHNTYQFEEFSEYNKKWQDLTDFFRFM